jgi:hypothetical protein
VVVQKDEAENVFVQGDKKEKEKESGVADGSTEVALVKAKVTVAFLEPAAKVNGKGIVPVTGNGFDDASRGGFGEEEESNFQGTQACRGQGTEARRQWSEEPGFGVAWRVRRGESTIATVDRQMKRTRRRWTMRRRPRWMMLECFRLRLLHLRGLVL